MKTVSGIWKAKTNDGILFFELVHFLKRKTSYFDISTELDSNKVINCENLLRDIEVLGLILSCLVFNFLDAVPKAFVTHTMLMSTIFKWFSKARLTLSNYIGRQMDSSDKQKRLQGRWIPTTSNKRLIKCRLFCLAKEASLHNYILRVNLKILVSYFSI